jgi:TolB-like protein
MKFIRELKQRKLFQWAVAYLAGAWVLMQLIDVLGGRWGVSDAAARIVDVVMVVGFFITLILAWYHGDQGHQRVSGPELLIIATLLALGGLALGMMNFEPVPPVIPETVVEQTVSTDEEPWIAVLPFKVQASDPMLTEMAAGLTEDISNGLSDFSYLLVLSRNAISGSSADTFDVRKIGSELGARYVLQGSLRKAGATTRVTAQLVDAQNGTQIWTETFDRDLTAGDALAVQDEITDRIVATVADPAGIVVRTLAAPTDRKASEDLTPYEAVLRYFLFQQRVSEADHLATRAALERAIEIDPGYADAWTSLSLIYQQEFMNNLNQQPDSLAKGLEAAQRAIDLDPTSARAHFAMAQVHYFMREISAFRVHAGRAIELNPRNTDSMAMIGILTSYSGEWDRGIQLSTHAMQLNPHHAGWYYFNSFFNEYRQQNYERALEVAQKINLPGYWATPLVLAISNAELGNEAAARSFGQDILRIWPSFEQEYYQLGLVNWMWAQPDLVNRITNALNLAGVQLETGSE